MKIEIHILQNFPPANLNRDDTGAPKDCFFGGVRRARISSQCLKRNVRISDTFKQYAAENLGVRTKRIPKNIGEILTKEHKIAEEEGRVLGESMLNELLSLSDAGEAKYLVYIGKDELSELAHLLAGICDEVAPDLIAAVEARALKTQTAKVVEGLSRDAEKKEKEDAKKAAMAAAKRYTDALAKLGKTTKPLAKSFIRSHRDHVQAIDIALFGRMLADTPELNIDASSQVAHALSTNAVQMEFDYYTAVDDLKQEAQETGAGMIGTIAFNSSTFYRYAVIDLNQLAVNLNGDRNSALEGAQAFMHAFIQTIPSGKQNTFAAHTPPSLVVAVARPQGTPFSLADAFDAPVYPNGKGLIAAAVERLDEHWLALADAYPLPEGTVIKAKVVKGKGDLNALADYQVASIPAVVDDLIADIAEQGEEAVA